MKRRPAKKTELFRVYIEQVNQTYVDVRASDEYKAEEKAYRKWRRYDAHARASVSKLPVP